MDIYTAQSAADRLLKFVQDASQAPNKKYGKSADRFKRLEDTCREILDGLERYRSDKFGCSTIRELDPPNAPDEHQLADSCPKHTRAQVVANYHVIIQRMARTRSGYHEVDAFLAVLQKWYEARFITQGSAPEFKCNTKYMGKWILCLAVGYGNAIERGAAKEYLSSISTFSENLAQDFATSKYVLPYDIYQATRELSGESVSLTGAVVWDVLYDLGLYALNPGQSVSYLPRDAAKQLYDQRSDDSPYYYNYYKDSDKVRKRVKLTPYCVEEDSEC